MTDEEMEEIPEHLRPAGEGYLRPDLPKSAHNVPIRAIVSTLYDIPEERRNQVIPSQSKG